MSFQAVVEIPTSVRRWKSYPSYKDSDIEWLGKIPAHWETKAVWILFRLGRGRVISNEEILDNPGPYPVYSSQTENEGIMGYIDTYDFDGNYITWTTDGANAGTVFHRAGKFNCTNVCGTLFAQRSDIDLRYFAHALNLATSWFVRHDINPKLMNNVMARIRVQVLPAAEQHYIATFLDRETAKTDALVAKKKRLIELLQEKRAALITRAVTKGLPSTGSGQATPNVPMKDSGVEWLGLIPPRWKVRKVKEVSKLQTGLTLGKKYEGERLTLRPYLRVANVQDGYLDLEEITEVEVPASDVWRHELQHGDVLMTEGGDFDKLGRGYVWEGQIPGCLHQNHIFAVRPTKGLLDSHFLTLVMNSHYGRAYFTATSKQSTNLASTNSTKLRNFSIPFPDLLEQEEIVNWVRLQVGRINSLIAKIREGIEKLMEYRTALISAAVTGKIDVREEISSRMGDSPERDAAISE